MSAVEYRDVAGVDGYCIGSDGSLWSAWKRGGGVGGHSIGDEWRQLKPETVRGYLRYTLAGGRRRFAHVLVLTTFVGPCPPGMECRHLDGNRENPALSNLAWGTKKENAEDKALHGTQCRGETCGRHKLTADQVAEIRWQRQSGMTLQKIAERYGVTCQTINAIDLGRSWRVA